MGGAISTDLTTFYGNAYGNPQTADTGMSMSAYYNQPDPAPQGNRQQRRAMAAQKRRKKK